MQISKIVKSVVAAAAVVAAGSAAAAPISTAFNFVPFGTVTLDTSDVNTATTASAAAYGVNGVDTSVATNNIGVSLGGPITLSTVNFVLGSSLTKTFTVGGINYIESLTIDFVGSNGSSRSITATGTITCGLGCAFEDSAVYFSGSYTQNAQGQVNASFNNSTVPPPPVRVPEPGSMALVGLALAGLALTARRRAK